VDRERTEVEMTDTAKRRQRGSLHFERALGTEESSRSNLKARGKLESNATLRIPFLSTLGKLLLSLRRDITHSHRADHRLCQHGSMRRK
jgi:hypothetical protein